PPGRPALKAGSFSKLLRRDLSRARDVRIVSAYFLPTYRLRRALTRAARRGGRVRLVLPGKTDVPISKLAARNFYKRLLEAGVEIYEYEPQILHAKLICLGAVTYIGSANLDIRSLRLNYELVIRFQDKAIADGAAGIFENILAHSQRIEPKTWHQKQPWWQRWKYRWANFLLTRVDPYVALRQFREKR
ncbi:MAG: phospholipase D-like domain-containing protein, partial [Limisphaerales bacterium]